MDNIEMFPVMNAALELRRQKDYVPLGWVMRHERQCLSNHSQTVKELARRGGLSHKELYAVLMDKRYHDVKMTEDECKKVIHNMVVTWVKENFMSFTQYLVKLSELAQNVTHENFVELQKLQADILNTYTAGFLPEAEKRALYAVSAVIMDNMRKTLNERNGDK